MAIKDDEVSSADTDRSAQDSLRRRRVQAVECHAENEKKLKKKKKKENRKKRHNKEVHDEDTGPGIGERIEAVLGDWVLTDDDESRVCPFAFCKANKSNSHNFIEF